LESKASALDGNRAATQPSQTFLKGGHVVQLIGPSFIHGPHFGRTHKHLSLPKINVFTPTPMAATRRF